MNDKTKRIILITACCLLCGVAVIGIAGRFGGNTVMPSGTVSGSQPDSNDPNVNINNSQGDVNVPSLTPEQSDPGQGANSNGTEQTIQANPVKPDAPEKPESPSGTATLPDDHKAEDVREKYSNPDLKENDCYQYAALRHLFYQQGKTVEILANYEPHLTSFGEWFKQLFAESEGKEHKGIFPVAANFSTDLHSIGQYIQDGLRCFFETVLWVKTPKSAAVVPFDAQDEDGLNFLAEKEIHFVNSKAFAGTMLAHMDGGVPNLVIELDKMDAYHFGALVYFFEKAVGISGYLLDVNPFDQPGVEAYKKNMFALLGKPGYEDRKAELEARL